MANIEERLENVERGMRDLVARDALHELVAKYCRQVVLGDTEGVVGLFTEDGSIQTHLPDSSGREDVRPCGTEQLREAYSDLGDSELRPCIHNHIVELDGDRARGFCSVEIRLKQGGVAYTASGHYEDEYRRVDDVWCFQHRELHVYHWVPHTQGWA
jgi:hypothetical protein